MLVLLMVVIAAVAVGVVMCGGCGECMGEWFGV